MKLLLLLTLLLSGCKTTEIKTETAPTLTPEPITLPEMFPREVLSLVNVTSTKNFSDKEKEKMLKYIPVMDKTIRSDCFEKFMARTDRGNTKNMGLIETKGMSPKEVVSKLRTSTVDIELIMYYKRWSKVSGYTEPGADWIKLNRKYHSGASLCSEASNLGHELSHKIGFGHSYKATPTRPFTVPYSINAGFTACCVKE